MWGGRFSEAVLPVVEQFGESVSFDKTMYAQDLRGSRAHADMLCAQGLMDEADREAIFTGLAEIEAEIEDGSFEWRADREDVHMNIESALIEKVGEPGKKLHTARSRNDQVITDVRLWMRDSIDELEGKVVDLQRALVLLADANEGLVVPGYTHLQRAQPILLQHQLLAYVEQLERDLGRLRDCRARANQCPLGACAMAGTGLPIDRHATAKALGFDAPTANSVDSVMDRDFIIEYMSALSIVGMHLSRLGEEWVLWASEEFSFITPADNVSTGSSIMPQKKNPDPMEIVRGKSARVIGNLVTLLTLCKGLPSTYNRDLQEDKEPLFDAVDTVMKVVEVTTAFAYNVTFNKEHIAAGLGKGFLDATTLADYLVRKGMPFRSAHEVVGRCVALGVAKDCELKELSLDDMRAIDPIFEDDVYMSLGVDNAVAQFQSYGSTGKACVAEQMDQWKAKLLK
eukprot:PRCOL_00005568-RA